VSEGDYHYQQAMDELGWSDAASSPRLVPERFRVADRHGISIEWRGKGKWCVTNGLGVLSKSDKEFVWEPQPSSRDEAFIADTRFDSPEEALAALDKAFPRAPRTQEDETNDR
jgi:hypothetical protein